MLPIDIFTFDYYRNLLRLEVQQRAANDELQKTYDSLENDYQNVSKVFQAENNSFRASLNDEACFCI